MPGHLVRRYHQITVAIFMNAVGKAGFDLTPVQFATLATTSDHPGIDQATLAGLIAYDRNTIGGVVDRLVRKGHLRRTVSKRDRRARQLQLTAQGEDVLRKVTPIVDKVQGEMLAGLSSAEADQLVSLLGKVTESANGLSRAPLRPIPEDQNAMA